MASNPAQLPAERPRSPDGESLRRTPEDDLRDLALELHRQRQERRLARQDRRAVGSRQQQAVAQVPAVDAQLYANIGRYAGNVVMATFENLGGVDGLTDWAEENPTDFYTKLLPKVITAPKQIEVGGTITLEEAVKALDMQEGVDYHVVESQPAEERRAEPDPSIF